MRNILESSFVSYASIISMNFIITEILDFVRNVVIVIARYVND